MGHEVYTDFRCFATWCLASWQACKSLSAAIANMSIEMGGHFEAQKLTFTRRKIDAVNRGVPGSVVARAWRIYICADRL